MDGRQFDRLTRALTATSRRDAIRLLFAGLATGSLTAGAPGAIAQVAPLACGKDGDSCNERNGNRDCCSGFKCKNDKCRDKDRNRGGGGCGKDGDSCDERDGNRDCCSGFKCKNDRCRSKGGNGGGCGREGDDCRNRGCCKGFRCRNDRCRRKN